MTESPQAYVEGIAELLAAVAPQGFSCVRAVLSVADAQEIVVADAETAEGSVVIGVPTEVMRYARVHRMGTTGRWGPWWRMLIEVLPDGTFTAAADYGEDALPVEHRLPAQAYRADLERYPRESVPLWLMAHVAESGWQVRAAGVARDSVARGQVRAADEELPSLPQLWSRLACLAAVLAGIGMSEGLRADPAWIVYRDDGAGCTLARLHDGRAVLSGGSDTSTLLAAAYRGDVPMPDLLGDAPPWVHALFLDERASLGTMSFCYWWDGRAWYRSELTDSPEGWAAVDETYAGLPDVWTTADTAALVVSLLTPTVAVGEMRSTAEEFVRSAEAGVVSRRCLDRLVGEGTIFAFGEAMAQLDAAGICPPPYEALDADQAKRLAAESLNTNGAGVENHSLDGQIAVRLDTGWHVSTRVAEGQFALTRAAAFVADDGVVEAVPLGPFADAQLAFAARFAARVRSATAAALLGPSI